jgi:hypothetical protein
VPDNAPNFAQPERRSFLIPVLVALAAIGLAIAVAVHFFPATTVNIDHVGTQILPTHTVIKAADVIGAGEVDDILYVASTVRIENQLRLPLYLDDFHLTFTDANGAEETVRGAEVKDIPSLESSFPNLKPLVTAPLARDTVIDPAKSAQGVIVFSLNMTKEQWDQRKSAVIKVDLYHQPAVYTTIPK